MFVVENTSILIVKSLEHHKQTQYYSNYNLVKSCALKEIVNTNMHFNYWYVLGDNTRVLGDDDPLIYIMHGDMHVMAHIILKGLLTIEDNIKFWHKDTKYFLSHIVVAHQHKIIHFSHSRGQVAYYEDQQWQWVT